MALTRYQKAVLLALLDLEHQSRVKRHTPVSYSVNNLRDNRYIGFSKSTIRKALNELGQMQLLAKSWGINCCWWKVA